MVDSPRKQAKSKTARVIGKRTGVMLQQEFFSLMSTKDAFRDKKWESKWVSMKKDILELKEGNLVYSSFVSKYQHLGRIPNWL